MTNGELKAAPAPIRTLTCLVAPVRSRPCRTVFVRVRAFLLLGFALAAGPAFAAPEPQPAVEITPQPTPPPAPTPTPTPKVIPPLSIYDATVMLREVRNALEAAEQTAGLKLPLNKLDERLAVAATYIGRVQQANPTLPHYRWYETPDAKVFSRDWKPVVYVFDNPRKDVTALLLRSRNGNVEISKITVTTRQGREFPFDVSILLHDSQPRREVMDLPLPADLERVEFLTRKAHPYTDGRPKIQLMLGVCQRVEWLKQAGYYIQLGRELMRGEQRAGAIEHIDRAIDRLEHYRNETE